MDDKINRLRENMEKRDSIKFTEGRAKKAMDKY